jgi:hypothetical protein
MAILNTSIADFIANSERLIVTVADNAVELGYLEPSRAQLALLVEGVKESRFRQGALKAQTQQASRDLGNFLTEGRELATRLRNSIRGQYGVTTEKLVEFGLQPRRSPSKAKAPKTAPPSPALDAGSSQEGTSDKPPTT